MKNSFTLKGEKFNQGTHVEMSSRNWNGIY